MLRRRPDNTFEYRHVEMALRGMRPLPLGADRREALRMRIMANLGVQDRAVARAFVIRERWVAIPAGVGIAAAIIAGSQFAVRSESGPGERVVAQAAGDVLVDGQPGRAALPGQVMTAASFAWIGITDDLRVGMEPGARITFVESSAGIVVTHQAGDVTFVAGAMGMRVDGVDWSASVAAHSVMKLAIIRGATILSVEEGSAEIALPGGVLLTLTSANSPAIIPAARAAAERPEPVVSHGSENDAPGDQGNPGQADDETVAAAENSEDPPGRADPPGNSENPPGPPDPPGNSGNAPGQSDPPGGSGNAPGQSDPPGGSGNAPGQSDPPGGSGNAPGQSDPPGNSGNAPGQSDPPGGSGNAPGHGDPPGNSGNPPGQSDPPGNSGNPPGQSDPPGGSGNAPGQSAPPGGSGNAPGQSDPPGGSGNAPGQSDPPGNSGNAPGHQH